MPNVTTETTETRTPYGTIFRAGDREWFPGSVEEFRTAKAWEAYRKPLDALKSLYDEACAARDAANGTPSWDYLDRRCATLAREIDDFVRGRANAINAGNY